MLQLRPALPRELRKKIAAEKNPDAVLSEALTHYYSGKTRVREAEIQKEIDNNIIEVQRRHISDLKDQLQASNKNYEELMKTYQAYMLQVQPMVEAAQLPKATESELLAGDPKRETELQEKEAELKKQFEELSRREAWLLQEKDDMQRKAAELRLTEEALKKEAEIQASAAQPAKKWYVFWK